MQHVGSAMAKADDRMIGKLLQSCYLFANMAWMLIFLGFTRGTADGPRDQSGGTSTLGDMPMALVYSILSGFPGGAQLHLWLPLILGVVSDLRFGISMAEPMRTQTEGLGLTCWSVCIMKNPGVVSNYNARGIAAFETAIAPNLAGPARGLCNICQISARPSRTHHCRTCNHCVFRFDHHCYWMGVCIGAKNIRWCVLPYKF